MLHRLISVTLGLAVAAASLNAAAADDDNKIKLGLRLGYGLPFGSAYGDATRDMNEAISGQIPIWVDAGVSFPVTWVL